MLVLIFWAAAVGIGVVLLGSIGYGLVGHLSRLRRAVADAEAGLEPALRGVRRQSPPGRHRAT